MLKGNKRAGPGAQSFSFLLTHSLPQRARRPLTQKRGQSKGDRKLSRTEGGDGIIIDNNYNGSRNGVGALC